MDYRAKATLKRVFGHYLPLAVFLLFILFPFYWTFVTSITPEELVIKLPVRYFPAAPTFENYRSVWGNDKFQTYFFNSFIVSGATVVAVTLCSILGGYALARFKFKGKGVVMVILLLTQMLPSIVLVIPLFKTFMGLNLINTRLSLILTYTTTQLAFCLIMMSGFFAGLPPQLEEAAQIDGCTLMGAVFRVVLPALAPGIVATGAYAFVGAWNDFFYALNFINNQKLFTISVGLNQLKGEFTVQYASLAAGSIISLLPVLLLFAYIQKYLVTGLAAGAVKG